MNGRARLLKGGPLRASRNERRRLEELQRALADPRARPGRARLVTPAGETLDVPRSLYRVLVRVVNEMVKGNAVTVTSIDAELNPEQAADLLGISLPELTQLVDTGVIPSQPAGKHPRVLLADLLAYGRAGLDHHDAGGDPSGAECSPRGGVERRRRP